MLEKKKRRKGPERSKVGQKCQDETKTMKWEIDKR